ncbi:MAG: sialate O-acetylesterase [Planctomycetota bacterium]|nr:sialate O-acetylesterase [Planctomycetota bacterium]
MASSRTQNARPLLVCALAGFILSAHSPAPRDPVQVFVLVGQSNMEGKGAIRHLDLLIEGEETRATFRHLKRRGKWVERDDVFITYDHGENDHRSGGLTVGYGSRKEQIGPELGFGHVVGDAIAADVLLIKCAWGGASLAKDFLPPSAGGPGGHYTRMVAEVRAALEDIADYVPGYRGRGYELAGLVWFQGWNDSVGGGNPDYTEQLACFIRDVRAELEVPDLPVVIGELGQAGAKPESKKVIEFRRQQQAVAELDGLAGTVRYVPTGIYVDPRLQELFDVWQRCNGAARKAEDEEAKEASWSDWNAVKDEYERSASDRPYHYHGSAKTFYLMGDAFGRAMLELLGED